MRKPSASNPTRLSDTVNLGADFRFMLNKKEAGPAASFAVVRNAFYVLAVPTPELALLYNNNQGATAEMYALAKLPGDFPAYLRAGRFFIPYGLQLNDPDNSGLTRISPFAPSVGFSLSPTQSDTGIEFGLAPKSEYFFNLSVTNGAANGAAAASEAKAIAGRWGFVGKTGAMGATFFHHRNSDSAAGQNEIRYGIFGWTRFGMIVFIGEGGWGTNTANAGSAKTHQTAFHGELNYEMAKDELLLRGQLDNLNPDTKKAGDSRTRYILGAEWFLLKYLSLETQLRIVTETPSVPNNEILALTHVWF
ncbi:MAG: hypothetical protein AAB091_08250 [Elusimicrobiota bacterium]